MKHSWAAIIQKLIPYGGKAGGMGSFASAGDFSDMKAVLLTGEVQPAMPGRAQVFCRCDNTMGMNNNNSVLGEKYNEAAHRVLEKPLADAIQIEFEGKLAYANQQEWAALEPELKALGVMVSR